MDLPKDTKIVAAGSEQTDDTEFYLEYDDENDGDEGGESVTFSDSDEEDDHAALQQRMTPHFSHQHCNQQIFIHASVSRT